MENFDSELKSMILKWLRRGYNPMRIQDALEATGRLFDRLPDAQDYIEAIRDGNKLMTNAVEATDSKGESHVNFTS